MLTSLPCTRRFLANNLGLLRLPFFLSQRRNASSLPQARTSKTVLEGSHQTILGSTIPSVEIKWTEYGSRDLPHIFIAPSFSHSHHLRSHEGDEREGWWEKVVGPGPEYAVDCTRFHVICASNLGAPFGSTSPLTAHPTKDGHYGADFPQITPADIAACHGRFLEQIGVTDLFGVIGASLGGMIALEFAAQFPERVERLCAICTTGRSSPATIALRSVQRAAVQMDANYKDGWYDPTNPPLSGLNLARRVGTICYRTKEEFNQRFSWGWKDRPFTSHGLGDGVSFEVEEYLAYAGKKFAGPNAFDPNCYVLMSKAMDLMDLGCVSESFEEGAARISSEVLLIAAKTDMLIPPGEMEQLAAILGSRDVKVHLEVLPSLFGHDAFLKDYNWISPCLSNFLNQIPGSNGVDQARQYHASIQ